MLHSKKPRSSQAFSLKDDTVKHCLQLHDGPLDGLKLSADTDAMERIQSISISYEDADSEDCDEFASQSTTYELEDREESDGVYVHRLFHARSLPATSPVGTDLFLKLQRSMTSVYRHRWNDWRWQLFEAAENCRDITLQCGDDRDRELIDTFQSLVLNIPFMEPAEDG